MAEVDLSQLPAPTVVEALDFEAFLAELKLDLAARYPEVASMLDLESEPLVKLLEVAAYRELILRARINDAARACMLAYAGGADLDNLAALLGVARLVVTPGDLAATPPVPDILESDADLRRRAQMALESATVAGSRGAYIFHALSAHGEVADAAVESPMPGVVRIAVLSRLGDGTPSAAVLAAVQATLSAEDVRPLTDQVQVESATIVPFAVEATLYIAPGPAPGPVREAALAALNAYLARPRRIGADVPRSALYAALHQAGVSRVALMAPTADIPIGPQEAGYCTGVTLATETEA